MGWVQFSLLGFFFLFSISAVSKMVYMVEAVGGEKQIAISNSDGTESYHLTSGSLWHLYPDIDSSGQWVAYVEGEGESETGPKLNIVTLNLRTNEKIQWTSGDGMYLHPNFSGDGRFLAFSGPVGEGGVQRVAIIDLKRQKRDFKLITSDFPSYFPGLSSDGSFVVFQRTKSSKNKDIVLVDLASGSKEVFTDPDGLSMAPALSFDDQLIAYTSKVEENWDIYVKDRRSKKVIRVTTHPSRDFAPTFRPNGSLVFASDRSGHFELYEVDLRDSQRGEFAVQQIVQGADSYYSPSVSGSEQVLQEKKAEILPPSRSSFGAVRVGERIYISGGHQGAEHTYPPESFLDRLEYFDLNSNRWVTAAPRSVPCHGFGLATKGKFIYAFGGFAYSKHHKPAWKSLDIVERYDTENDTWKVVAKLPRRRSSNVVAQLGDKVYLIGGWDATPKFEGDYDGTFHREIDVFDLATETVSVEQDLLPKPLRRAFSGVVLGEEIILLGGLGKGATHFNLIDDVTSWNPRTKKWNEFPRLPFATFAPAAGTIRGEIFVFGGMFKTGEWSYEYVNHIFSLKKAKKSWLHTGRYLSETKAFSQVVPIDSGKLAVLGGHSYEGGDAPVPTFETFEVKIPSQVR